MSKRANIILASIGFGLLFHANLALALDPIETFVQRDYYDGISFIDVTQYNKDDLNTLIGMLKQKEYARSWRNIAVMIGMFGKPVGTAALVEFIERESMAPSPELAFKAKRAALMSLGYIVNKSNDKLALQYLIDSASLRDAGVKKAKWKSAVHANQEERDRELADQAALGLALAGKWGRPALTVLRDDALKRKKSQLHPDKPDDALASWLDILDTAWNEQTKVIELGIEEYDRRLHLR